MRTTTATRADGNRPASASASDRAANHLHAATLTATASKRAATSTRRPSGQQLEGMIQRITAGHAPGAFRTEEGRAFIEITLTEPSTAKRGRNKRDHHARRVRRITFTPDDQPREEV